MSVPFCWRRRFPLVVLALALSVLAIRVALHRNGISAFAAVLVAAYGLGAYAGVTRRYARWLGWLALAAAVIAVPLNTGDRLAAVPFALLAAALVLGDAASARRAEAAATVEAAHQAERTRIARELHDVVAHQLSAIAVQAGAARIAASSAPGGQSGNGSGPDGTEYSHLDPPTQVLATVERLAREALTELNHLLGALRREPADDLSRPPAPTLAELETLLATSRAAGPSADLVIEGNPRPLSPGVELSCYRIIAEALANVARHAPAAPTRVVLRYQPCSLGIEVANGPPPGAHRNGAGPRPGSGGRGVRGMRERAELYGGHLAAGPAADGGFAITAEIPYEGATSPYTITGPYATAGHDGPLTAKPKPGRVPPPSRHGSEHDG
jgi:signal transduction histidine kinase